MIGLTTSILRRLSGLSRLQKQAIVVMLDAVLCFVAILIGYSLRVDQWIVWNLAVQRFTVGAIPVMLVAFATLGVYQTIFRFAGSGMMHNLARAFLAYTGVVFVVYGLIGVFEVPRTLSVTQPALFFLLVASSRVIARYLFVDILGRRNFEGTVKRVLVYGAGSAGQQLVSSMKSEPGIEVRGYIEDDKRLEGQKLDGIRVYHSKTLEKVIEREKLTDILLALPNISRKRRSRILDGLREYPVHVQTLPQMTEIVDGKVSFSEIRELELEDLLGREPVVPNELLLRRTIFGKVVLVTGAGGSIGSELCLQILRAGAASIILFEMSEFALYAIEKKLTKAARAEGFEQCRIIPVLGSVIVPERVTQVFQIHRPDTVFHAAAYKHVPLVEANPIEGIHTNILGTFEVSDAAWRSGVKDFILISTDKAVRPTNVMGASKRAAEQIVQAHAENHTGTRFSMVRFGNVLGSSGSVVPLFRQQIGAGGPVTVTHPEVTRYFMTIPEAAQLVIQASGLAKGGEVFVLDMGQSVQIYQLARTMIRLSGFTVQDEKNPDGDIPIEFVGLRSGEKLYEELIIGNDPQKTSHAQIMMAHEQYMAWPKLEERIAGLRGTYDAAIALKILCEIVPEFEHDRDVLLFGGQQA